MISCKLIHVCMNSQEAAGSGGLLILVLVLVFGWLILTIPVLASRHLISGASGGQRASSWNPAFSLNASKQRRWARRFVAGRRRPRQRYADRLRRTYRRRRQLAPVAATGIAG